MIDWHNRTLIAGAAAVLIAGFGIGFLTDHALSSNARQNAASATAEIGQPATGLFGKVRDKNAPRASDKKPAGFAVWKQNHDTSGSAPKACVQL
jgi:hypothetical protein